MNEIIFWTLVVYIIFALYASFRIHIKAKKEQEKIEKLNIILPTTKERKETQKPFKVLENNPAETINLFYPKELDPEEVEKEIINYFKGNVKGVKAYTAECRTKVDKMPFTLKEPEGYEYAKFDGKTGKLYYPSDGSYTEHVGLRKIPN